MSLWNDAYAKSYVFRYFFLGINLFMLVMHIPLPKFLWVFSVLWIRQKDSTKTGWFCHRSACQWLGLDCAWRSMLGSSKTVALPGIFGCLRNNGSNRFQCGHLSIRGSSNKQVALPAATTSSIARHHAETFWSRIRLIWFVSTKCLLCEKESPLTFHHLIPKKCHTKKWFRKRSTRQEIGRRGIDICSYCHQYIHKLYSEKELGRDFNTLEKLLADEQLQAYLDRVAPDRTGLARRSEGPCLYEWSKAIK